MNFTTTLILLAVLIGVGIFVFTIDTEPPINRDDIDRAKKHFFLDEAFDPLGLTEIKVSWADGQSGTLAKDADGSWFQTEPVRFPMNRVQIQSGMGITAEQLTYLEKFMPGEAGKPSLADLNLATPKAVIAFKGIYKSDDPKFKDDPAKPFAFTISLGNTVTGNRGYAKVNDDPHAYVITGQLHQLMANNRLADWRSRKLAGPGIADAKRIVITTKSVTSPKIELAVKDEDWFFAGSNAGRANPKSVKAILGGIGDLKMGRFHNEKNLPLDKFGLASPRLIATFESTSKPHKRVLRIGDSADINNLAYYATWSTGDDESTVVFSMARESKARFETHVDEMRDPRVTPIRASQVIAFSVDKPGSPLVQLEKSPESGWSFGKNTPFATLFSPDQNEVGKWIEAVTSGLSKGYVANVKLPKAADRLATVVVSSLQPRMDDTLVLFKPPAGSQSPDDKRELLALLRNDESTAYLVPADVFSQVLKPAVTLRNRDVAHVNLDLIREIQVKRYDGVTYEFFRDKTMLDFKGKPMWQLRGHKKFEAQSLYYLLSNLNPIRGERWLLGVADVSKKPVTLVIKPESPQAKPLTFIVDISTHQATFSAVPNGFVVAKEFAGLIDAEFRPRTVVDVARPQLEEVAVQQGKHNPLRIQRDDRGLFRAMDAAGQLRTDIQIDQRGAARMFDSLAPLQVDRYVQMPEGVKLEQALRTFELRTKSQRVYKVHVGFPEHEGIAHANGKWFTLPGETLSRLSSKTASQKVD